MRARLCAIRTFAFSSRLLKHAIRHSGQFSLKPRLPEFHSDVADRGPEANPTVWPQPGARLQTRYMNLKVERSISLNSGESPIASIPPPPASPHSPSHRCLSARDSIHIHNQPPQHRSSQLTPVVYLPLCLPFAVILTLPGVSLEQDAYLPLSLSDFASIYHSRLCLCRVLFSNTKPPLGAERVNGAPAAQGVAQ